MTNPDDTKAIKDDLYTYVTNAYKQIHKNEDHPVPYLLLYDLIKKVVKKDTHPSVIHGMACNQYLAHFTDIDSYNLFKFEAEVKFTEPMTTLRYVVNLIGINGARDFEVTKFEFNRLNEEMNKLKSGIGALDSITTKRHFSIGYEIELFFKDNGESEDISSTHDKLIVMCKSLQRELDINLKDFKKK